MHDAFELLVGSDAQHRVLEHDLALLLQLADLLVGSSEAGGVEVELGDDVDGACLQVDTGDGAVLDALSHTATVDLTSRRSHVVALLSSIREFRKFK